MELDKTRCDVSVSGYGRFGWVHPHQCRRKIWKDGFCKQHHPSSVKNRMAESDKRFEIVRKRWRLERVAPILLIALEELVNRLETEKLVSPSMTQMKQAKKAIKTAKGE